MPDKTQYNISLSELCIKCRVNILLMIKCDFVNSDVLTVLSMHNTYTFLLCFLNCLHFHYWINTVSVTNHSLKRLLVLNNHLICSTVCLLMRCFTLRVYVYIYIYIYIYKIELFVAVHNVTSDITEKYFLSCNIY